MKIIIIAGVIFTGLMLGVVFANFFPEVKNLYSQNNSESTSEITSDEEQLEVSLETSHKELGIVPDETNTKENFNNIEKATLTVNYTNNSTSKLNNVRVRFFVSGKNRLGFSGSPEMKLTEGEDGITTFSAPSIEPGESGQMQVSLFSYTAGEVTIHANVLATPGLSRETNKVSILFK